MIFGINGPVVTVLTNSDSKEQNFQMSEMVYVSKERLIGEVISMQNNTAVIQVFEETSGLKPGDEVYGTKSQLQVVLGPGIIGNIFDGIQRPLEKIANESGTFIPRGANDKQKIDNLDMEKPWKTRILIASGQKVSSGTIVAEVPETSTILHKVMLPPDISGTVKFAAKDGEYTLKDTIATVVDESGKEHNIKLCQKWSIRIPRPVASRQPITRPLITGQRVIDTLFPLAKGGMAAVPGGFGTGKTMTQHQLAKWSDADIIVYIGCGERGNEMTQVLEDFKELKDPKTKMPLMHRTTLIANTSNMPVAAREASIYTGITIAEYYRDMGYHVAIMADSTSRWAEALRELSGRLEEMPAEEGFPAYLSSRLAAFYERAGYVKNLNNTEGSVTIIGAVSPQGGDFSEPVTMNTKRFVRCFWTLDRSLAYARHFPAIQWLTSYSEYLDDLTGWYNKNVGENFISHRENILRILHEESDLMDIVKLIGSDVLPEGQKLILEIAKVIRLGFVQQNAYHKTDTFVPFEKQMKMMEIILHLNEALKKLVSLGIPMAVLRREDIFDKIISIKYDVSNDELSKLDGYFADIDAFYDKVYKENV